MALSTYAELQAAVADWLDRTDLSSAIQDFITLAEADLNRRVRHYLREAVTTASASTQYTALPSDFHRIIRASVDGANEGLKPLNQQEMQDERYRTDDAAGEPCYYTITKGQLELFPTPDATYTINISYEQDIPDLATNSTNWLLTEAPDVYLYGALVSSAGYLVEDARLQTWGALYTQAVEELNADSQRSRWGNNLAQRVWRHG